MDKLMGLSKNRTAIKKQVIILKSLNYMFFALKLICKKQLNTEKIWDADESVTFGVVKACRIEFINQGNMLS